MIIQDIQELSKEMLRNIKKGDVLHRVVFYGLLGCVLFYGLCGVGEIIGLLEGGMEALVRFGVLFAILFFLGFNFEQLL